MRRALVAFLLGAVGTAPAAGASGRVAALSDEARKLYDQGQYEAALQAYQQALLEDPERLELQYNEGAARYKTGDLEAALQAFRQLGEGKGELAVRSIYNAGNGLYQRQEYGGG